MDTVEKNLKDLKRIFILRFIFKSEKNWEKLKIVGNLQKLILTHFVSFLDDILTKNEQMDKLYM